MAEMPPYRPAADEPARRRAGSKLWAWLQLLRLPNLFTVPGDPVVGLLLAQNAGLSASRPLLRLALAAAVSLLIYSSGLLWNDWFDLPEDRRERPGRPLPSGLVRPFTAAAAANVLMLLAVCFAAIAGRTTLYVAAALGAAALAYNARLKRAAVVGPLTMGLCRGLSVLVGAAAFGTAGLTCPPVLAFAGGVTTYIAAVTVLAAGETRPTAVRAKALLIVTMAAAWLLGLILTVSPATFLARWAMTGMAAATMAWLTWSLTKLGGDNPTPAAVQRAIGGLIRALVLAQAAAVVSLGWSGAAWAAALLGCFLANALLARRFYAS